MTIGPADLAGAAALGGILVWAVGYWARIPGQIRVESKDEQTKGTDLQGDEMGDMETRPKGWEGSE